MILFELVEYDLLNGQLSASEILKWANQMHLYVNK